MRLPSRPAIYEINTAIFLADLSRNTNNTVTLATVPDKVWDDIAALHIDAVWFMGVWERSPLAHQMALDSPEFKKFLPDLQAGDVLGSAYSIAHYSVSPLFGGPEGLKTAREALAKRGIGIVLDYVPNHVGLDHHWASEDINYFVQGTEEDLVNDPESFYRTPVGIVAKGRDPNFPPWSDVAQLNAFSPILREGVMRQLQKIASQCDGVRCDMAMLMMNEIFAHTWGSSVGVPPTEEYWTFIIPLVRQQYPDFIFIAEAYWDTEKLLIDQGFNYCYDKELYDHLMIKNGALVNKHITETAWYQQHLLRFIDNHDEKPPAIFLTEKQEKAAAVIMSTLDGARMYFDGQIIGYPVHTPVHLSRGPFHPVNESIKTFYTKLLEVTHKIGPKEGSRWAKTDLRSTWYSRVPSHLTAWSWQRDGCDYSVMVNYSPKKASANLPWPRTGQSEPEFVLSSSNNNFLKKSKNDLKITLEPWGYLLVAYR